MIVVASISCIYGPGIPEHTSRRRGPRWARPSTSAASCELVNNQSANDTEIARGRFRMKDVLEIGPA